jgi:hypothetical protein
MLDRTKRKVASECLRLLIDYKSLHQLWRIHSVWFEGLTPKEREYLKKCEQDLDAVYKRIAKLQYRLNRSS